MVLCYSPSEWIEAGYMPESDSFFMDFPSLCNQMSPSSMDYMSKQSAATASNSHKLEKTINREMCFNNPTTTVNYVKSEITENGFGNSRPYSGNCTPEMPDHQFQKSQIISNQPSFTNNRDAQQMEAYRDLILHHLIQDIMNTCEKLGLPTDPYMWTTEHVSKWIREMCQQFNLSLPKNCFFAGRILLSMNQREFEAWAPEGGDTIYAQLQLWKTAFESYHSVHSSPINNQTNNNVESSPVQRNVWCQSDVKDTMAKENFDIAGLYTGPQSNNGFKGNNSAQIQDSPVFFNSDMLSPSSSVMSSSASITDLNEDDGLDINMFNVQQSLDMQFTNCSGNISLEEEQKMSSYSRNSGTVHLWHFIRELLDHPKQYGSCVRWVDREEGTFKIESSHHLARFWGQRKNRSQMNYDKLSRSLRQYYKKGIIQKPEKKQRLVYKFLPPYNL